VSWGWTPPSSSPVAPAPDVISVRTGNGLQVAHDLLTSGGIIQLGAGTYYADPASPTTALSWTNSGIAIIGAGRDSTIIASPIDGKVGNGKLESLIIRPPGGAYGLKLFRDENVFPGGGGVPRWVLDRVFIGAADATGRDAGLGPAKGLWLDGAIVGLFSQCLFAFCSESGVYADTTQPPNWSTNVHEFVGCTMNLNSRYGVELVGSAMEGFRFEGGTMNSNVLGEVNANNMNHLELLGIDFETGVAVASVLNIGAVHPLTVEGCNFVTSGSTKAVRAFIFSTCATVRVVGNKFQGFTNAEYGIFDENCTNCIEYHNENSDGDDRVIVNRSGRS